MSGYASTNNTMSDETVYRCFTCAGSLGKSEPRRCRSCKKPVHHLDTCSVFCDTRDNADPGDYDALRMCKRCASLPSKQGLLETARAAHRTTPLLPLHQLPGVGISSDEDSESGGGPSDPPERPVVSVKVADKGRGRGRPKKSSTASCDSRELKEGEEVRAAEFSGRDVQARSLDSRIWCVCGHCVSFWRSCLHACWVCCLCGHVCLVTCHRQGNALVTNS
jgi:hypothetical protein